MIDADRENAVLASFLFADDMGTDTKDAFFLSEDAFTSAFRRRVAIRINATTAVDKAYALLSYDMQESIEGTTYEQEWINILAQTPMPFSLVERYHKDIRRAFNERIIRGGR